MQIGVIGLGRMGGNIARRLMRNDHDAVVFDRDAKTVKALAKDGAEAAKDLADFVSQLKRPRTIWIMLPAAHRPKTPFRIWPNAFPKMMW